MAKTIGAQLDFGKIPTLGFVPEASAVAPSSPGLHQLWTDTSETPNRLKIWHNGEWAPIATLNDSGQIEIGELPVGTGADQVASGDHTHALDSLSDVAIAGPATAQVLRYDGAEWVNAALGIGDVGGLQGALDAKAEDAHTHAAADIDSGTLDIARLPVAASGTSSTTQVVRADDSRLTDSRAPSGPAGGDLSGTYPNPAIGAGKVTDTHVAAANKDGVAGTPSMRTLGTGAQQALPGNTRLDQLGLPAGPVNLNGQRVAAVGSPTTGTDAANKDYVDAARAGITWKDAVRVVTTTNVNLASPGAALDGVAMAAGERFLAAGQSTASQNGIYVWNGAATAATRADDADTAADMPPGTQVFVNEGSNADSTWALITNAPITLDTTSLTFTQTSGGGQITAGAGLTKNDNTLDVVGTADRIQVNADSIDIAPTYAGQTSIDTVGTISTGVWEGTDVGVAHGGTGASDAAGARANLGAVGKYAADLGVVTAGVEVTVVHNLNSADVHAMFRTTADGRDIMADWRVIGANSIGVTFDTPGGYASGALRAVVMG